MASGGDAEATPMDQLVFTINAARHLAEGCAGKRQHVLRSRSVPRFHGAQRVDPGIHSPVPVSPEVKGHVRNGHHRRGSKLKRNNIITFQLVQ